jgi:hypothetical protein
MISRSHTKTISISRLEVKNAGETLILYNTIVGLAVGLLIVVKLLNQ